MKIATTLFKVFCCFQTEAVLNFNHIDLVIRSVVKIY